VKNAKGVGVIMEDLKSERENKNNIGKIAEKLEELRARRIAEDVLESIMGRITPFLEKITKFNEAISEVTCEIADLKLSFMKEIGIIRDLLRRIDENLVNLEKQISNANTVAAVTEGGEWRLEESIGVESNSVEGGDENAGGEAIVSEKGENELMKERDEPTEKRRLLKLEGMVLIPEERIQAYKEIAQLETRLVKIKGEIASLKNLIDVGLGTMEDKRLLEDKLEEKRRVEERIKKLKVEEK